MKNLTRIVMTLFTCMLIFAGCSEKNPKDLIVKKWQVTDVKVEGEEKMTPEQEKIMKSLVMEFTKDGKLLVTGLPSGTQSGGYRLSDDGKTLTTVNPSGDSTANNVTTLTDKKLVFKDPKAGLTFSTESK